MSTRLCNSALFPRLIRLLQLSDMIFSPLLASLGFLTLLGSGDDMAKGAGWNLDGEWILGIDGSVDESPSLENMLSEWNMWLSISWRYVGISHVGQMNINLESV